MSVKVDLVARTVELASGFTVGDYVGAVDARNRDVIAEGIHRRFTERYLEPVSDPPAKRHGFTMMAIACLMIEALESFRRGWIRVTAAKESKPSARSSMPRVHSHPSGAMCGTSTREFAAASCIRLRRPSAGEFGAMVTC